MHEVKWDMRHWLLALVAAALAWAGMLTDHFTSPPIEVWVTRTDQWLFCTDSASL